MIPTRKTSRLKIRIFFHYYFRRETSRHDSVDETPFRIYLTFLLHSQKGSALLVDKFHDLGLSISYD